MALINCPECNKSISSKAQSCPNCGYIISKKAAQEVELTGKDLKLHKVLSVLLMVIGLIWVMMTLNTKKGVEPPRIAFWFFFIGLSWFIISQIRTWWNNR